MVKIFNCVVCSSKIYKIFDRRKFNYFRCPACKHVTTYPYPTESQIKQHYSQGFKTGNYQVARKYSDIYTSNMNKFIKIVKTALLKQGKSIKDVSVLDIGCFTGEFLYKIAKEGANVCGIELQDEAVKIAIKKFPGKIIKANILDDNIALFKHQFDIVTLLGVIEHVTDPIKLLKRASELLKPQGLLMIQTPNSSSCYAKLMKKYWPSYTPIEHIHIFSNKSLFIALKKSGFKNIVSKRHWKKLSISYSQGMLRTFGPEFYKISKPIFNILPSFIMEKPLPIYIGEMIVLANI